MERHYNLDSGQLAAITAGVGAVGGVGAALAQRQRRELSEAEKKCGKRPMFRGKKRTQWEKCASAGNPTIDSSKGTPPIINQPMSKNLKLGLIIGGSVLGLALIGFVIYKIKNRAK